MAMDIAIVKIALRIILWNDPTEQFYKVGKLCGNNQKKFINPKKRFEHGGDFPYHAQYYVFEVPAF